MLATQTRPSQLGFTLIELTLVIVVLGVLSAFAIPRFADLSRNAQVAVIEQVSGAMKSTGALVQMQAKLNKVTNGTVLIDSYTVRVAGGFIDGAWNQSWRYALDIGDDINYTQYQQRCTDYDLCAVGTQPANRYPSLPITTNSAYGLFLIWPQGYFLNDECYAFYFNPQDGTSHSFGTVTNGC